MLESEHALHVKIRTTLAIAMVPVSFYLAVLVSRSLGKDPYWLSDFAGVLQLPMFLAVVAYAAVFGTTTKLYSRSRDGIARTTLSLGLAVSKGAFVFIALLFVFGHLHIGRSTYLLQAVFLFMLLVLERAAAALILHVRRKKGLDLNSVLIVGTSPSAKHFVDEVGSHPEWGVRLLGFLDWGERPELWSYRDIPLAGRLGDLARLVLENQVDYVVFAVSRNDMERITEPIRICDETGTPALLLADFFAPRIARPRVEDLCGQPVVYYAPTSQRELNIATKEAFDRLAAFVGLVFLLPILLAIAIAIKFADHGPIFFCQMRCGRNGRRFKLYKFRSMVPDAEARKASLQDLNEVKGAAFKLRLDPRVTRLGRLLRKSSLDELPQLWNVVCGHMSLVGPRPPLPAEVAEFDRWQRRKLSMKPGITGLWQVGGRSDVKFEEWMKMDLQYIDQWSLGLDAKILLKTIPAVFSARGAR